MLLGIYDNKLDTLKSKKHTNFYTTENRQKKLLLITSKLSIATNSLKLNLYSNYQKSKELDAKTNKGGLLPNY